MRIISGHICAECCYCMEDSDGFGVCCKDTVYRNIPTNQHACRIFCGDGEYSDYDNNNNITTDYTQLDDGEYYD